MSSPAQHPTAATLEALAWDRAVPAALARHLASCGACREVVAAQDPTVLFGLLGELPATRPSPAYPGIAAMLAAAPAELAPAPEPAGDGHRTPRLALAAAAAALLLVTLFAARHAPAPHAVRATRSAPAPTSELTAAPVLVAGDVPEVVSHVDSPTAEVISIVPPGGGGPTVTLIVDQEFDL